MRMDNQKIKVRWQNEHGTKTNYFDTYEKYLDANFGLEHSYIILEIQKISR